MKKKLLALLLVAVTLMSVLSLGVSAAGEKTLKSYLTLKSVQMSHSEITIVVTGDTVVDENSWKSIWYGKFNLLNFFNLL